VKLTKYSRIRRVSGTPWYSAGHITPMWHLFHFVVRPVEAFLGLFCVLTAVVLYPDEEGKIQSKFEDFWIKVDDYQQLALSRHAAFMQELAQLETRILDGFFGRALWSDKALFVSLFISVASVMAGTLFILHFRGFPFSSWLFYLFLGSLVVAIAISLLYKPGSKFGYLAIVVGLLCLSFFDSKVTVLSARDLNVARLVGTICDIAFIWLTRRLVKWAGDMQSIATILGLIIFNLLIAVCWVGPGILLVTKRTSLSGDLSRALAIISLSNIFDALLALLFVFLSVLLLVHRAVWPLLTRTLF
jgi:hypothetical protein